MLRLWVCRPHSGWKGVSHTWGSSSHLLKEASPLITVCMLTSHWVELSVSFPPIRCPSSICEWSQDRWGMWSFFYKAGRLVG